MNEVSHYVELRHVYDGWSVQVMTDGALVNRWPEGTKRHEATQEWIEQAKGKNDDAQ